MESIRKIIRKLIREGWEDTSWESETGEKVTIKDLLDYMEKNKDKYPVKQIPITDLEKIVIKKDSGGIESHRVDAADFKYPIIVVAYPNGKLRYILDGNHRAQKAMYVGLESIPARIIVPEELPDTFKRVIS